MSSSRRRTRSNLILNEDIAGHIPPPHKGALVFLFSGSGIQWGAKCDPARAFRKWLASCLSAGWVSGTAFLSILFSRRSGIRHEVVNISVARSH
jgi:hypothetical protein